MQCITYITKMCHIHNGTFFSYRKQFSVNFPEFTYEALFVHQINLRGGQILIAYLVWAQMKDKDIVQWNFPKRPPLRFVHFSYATRLSRYGFHYVSSATIILNCDHFTWSRRWSHKRGHVLQNYLFRRHVQTACFWRVYDKLSVRQIKFFCHRPISTIQGSSIYIVYSLSIDGCLE